MLSSSVVVQINSAYKTLSSNVATYNNEPISLRLRATFKASSGTLRTGKEEPGKRETFKAPGAPEAVAFEAAAADEDELALALRNR
jgi:hypothetical protein